MSSNNLPTTTSPSNTRVSVQPNNVVPITWPPSTSTQTFLSQTLSPVAGAHPSALTTPSTETTNVCTSDWPCPFLNSPSVHLAEQIDAFPGKFKIYELSFTL